MLPMQLERYAKPVNQGHRKELKSTIPLKLHKNINFVIRLMMLPILQIVQRRL
jgi:hypothetical protein